MSQNPNQLREIQTLGVGTRERILDWLGCASLGPLAIVAAGISEAGRGFEFVAPDPRYGVVMGCVGGTGRALVDGRWASFNVGATYIMPAQRPHAYAAAGRRPWRVCWVVYGPLPHGEPPSFPPAPTLLRHDARPLHAAIDALHRERLGHADPAAMHLLAALIDLHARRALGGGAGRARLHALWQAVDARLDHAWSLDELAHLANMSEELLRLVCRRETGRSPMEHVTHLRMQRAATMLGARELKIATVAQAVGYRSAFAFSTAFKRHIGVSPAAYRKRGEG